MLARLLGLVLWGWVGATSAAVPYVNWENHPVRALDISPDRRTLAVAHTADQRVQLFDISSGEAVALGSVVVGVDPVAVKFRTDGELWVVNHISDSVSIVDVAERRVRATLATDDEPFDVVFAQGKAFVSCSQVNRVLVFNAASPGAPQRIAINGEDPRALAVSADGQRVYAAIFESGNASTVLGGGLMGISVGLPNVVSDPRGPYGGVNPPPNAGSGFDPPLNTAATPPRVGLIVKKDGGGRWRDDNGSDWTRFVSGPDAAASGRRIGWDLPDRDLAIIDAGSLQVSYVSGLMNMVMALAVNPANGRLAVVGTDALNQIRFEPKINSQFVRVNLAALEANGSGVQVRDLNPQLDYRQITLPPAQRAASIGDPRAVVWQADGQHAYVAGLGSNNVVKIDAQGQRVGTPMAVGQGPIGLALDEPRGRMYVWNHFDASLSTIDLAGQTASAPQAVFNPLPTAIKNGRPLLYDTHLTSGLGQASCGSCHIDARMDRLAWDLGDPSQPPMAFNQNCLTQNIRACTDFHSMKGPMATQTLQDIIGHEPHHWRGDREGIEAFNPAFEGLLGNHRLLRADEMQAFEDFLATVVFPPNPFRAIDNSLPTALPLEGHYTSGRFAMAGLPLGTGNALRGLQLYTTGLLDPPFQCSSCHTLPTGMGSNGPLLLPQLGLPTGGRVIPHGSNGENHLGIVSTDGSTNISIKVPQLRNQYDKVGFEVSQLENNAGFGFLHDGSVDSIARFLSANVFTVRSDQDVADLVALMLAFSGSEFPQTGIGTPPPNAPAPPLSRDSHAAVGQQFTLNGAGPPPAFDTLVTLATAGKIDLIVRNGSAGYAFDRASGLMQSDDASGSLQIATLRAQASAAQPQTWTAVPAGLGKRLGIDRDGDGVPDRVEIKQGSNPADAASTTLAPATGLWFNPARSGHGLDLQRVGGQLVATWYTYDDAGEPTWYLAAGPFSNPWRGELARYVWNPATGSAVASTVGELTLTFTEAKRVTFSWRLGTRSGSEPMQTFFDTPALATPERSGIWFDPNEPGWGLSLYSTGDQLVSGLYFYDGGNQPRWLLGVGSNRSGGTVSLQSYRGSCPHCDYAPPTEAAGGSLVLGFNSGRAGSLRTDAFLASMPNAPWRRGPVAITPLSDLPLFPERQ